MLNTADFVSNKNNYTPGPIKVFQPGQSLNGGQSFNGGQTGGNGTFNFGNSPFYAKGANLDKIEGRVGNATQQATNVIDVRNPLQAALSQYQNAAMGIKPSQVSLGQNFAGPEQFQQGLSNGIDSFGQLGISEGLQNIALQRGAANNQISNTLGRTAGNEAIMGILQNQNLMKSLLASQPLITEAQKGTAQRVSDQISLQNTLQQLRNEAQLTQAGFNQQAQLAALQPQQNLLELLSGLQGQQRGVNATENQIGGRNFK